MASHCFLTVSCVVPLCNIKAKLQHQCWDPQLLSAHFLLCGVDTWGFRAKILNWAAAPVQGCQCEGEVELHSTWKEGFFALNKQTNKKRHCCAQLWILTSLFISVRLLEWTTSTSSRGTLSTAGSGRSASRSTTRPSPAEWSSASAATTRWACGGALFQGVSRTIASAAERVCVRADVIFFWPVHCINCYVLHLRVATWNKQLTLTGGR